MFCWLMGFLRPAWKALPGSIWEIWNLFDRKGLYHLTLSPVAIKLAAVLIVALATFI